MQVLEGAIHQAQLHLSTCHVGVAGGEAFMQTTKRHAYACGHGVRCLLQYLGLVAPWQKRGIAVHINDQIEHLLCAKPD